MQWQFHLTQQQAVTTLLVLLAQAAVPTPLNF